MHCRPNMPIPPLIHFREFDQHLLSSARLYRLFCIPHHMVQTGQSFCCGVDARTLRLQHIHLKQPSRTPLCLCCLSPANSARCGHFRLQIPVVCLTAAVSVSLCCRLRSMLADSLYWVSSHFSSIGSNECRLSHRIRWLGRSKSTERATFWETYCLLVIQRCNVFQHSKYNARLNETNFSKMCSGGLLNTFTLLENLTFVEKVNKGHFGINP